MESIPWIIGVVLVTAPAFVTLAVIFCTRWIDKNIERWEEFDE